MSYFRSLVRLEDDAAAQRKNRHLRLLSWAAFLIAEIIDVAVEISEDFIAAARRDQEVALRLEMEAAGLHETDIPHQFGKRGGHSIKFRGEKKSTAKHGSRRRGLKGSKSGHSQYKGVEAFRTGTVKMAESGNRILNVNALFAVGGECLCFYSGDCLWYRAVIVSIQPLERADAEKTYVVSLVGYDFTQAVPSSWIRLFPEEGTSGEDISEAVVSATPAIQSIHLSSGVDHEIGIVSVLDNSEAGKDTHAQTAFKDIAVSTPAVEQKRSRKQGGGANWGAEDARNPYEGFVSDKYWAQRYRFFSLYDQGVKLDFESWYSITPESISKHMAERCRCDVILDPFCGVGGNVIQLAMTCQQVIAMDVDPSKVAMARHNAKIYGVDDRIEFMVGDALSLLRRLRPGAVDSVLLSPPWGGSSYVDEKVYDIKVGISIADRSKDGGTGSSNCDGEELFRLARRVTKNVAYFLPRNVSLEQLGALVADQSAGIYEESVKRDVCEVQDQILNNKLKTRVAYYGGLANNCDCPESR